MSFRFASHDDADLPVNHDINVTPFIDVMLVLLIIFMVAAPLATVDIKVDLPVSSASPSTKPDQPIYLTIRDDGTMLVGERPVESAELGGAIRAANGAPTGGTVTGKTGAGEGPRIFLRADRKVPYERIMEAMNGLRAAGYFKIALVGLEGRIAR